MKRALSVFLSLLMLCTTPSMTAFAEDANSIKVKETVSAETIEVEAQDVSEVVSDVLGETEVQEEAQVQEATDAVKITEQQVETDEKAGFTVQAYAERDAYPLGATVVINSAITGAEGNITYKWVKSLNGTDWTNTNLGDNSPVLSFTATEARLSYFYRLDVTASNGTVSSNPVKVELAESPVITVSAKDAVPLGAKVVIKANCENLAGTISYQWQKSSNGTSWGNTSLSGNKTPELSFTATEARLSYYYRLVVKDANGRWVSNAVHVDLAQTPQIVIAANAESYSQGDKVVISITQMTGTDADVSYQWQKSLDGSSWSSTNLRGYNTNRLNFNATTARCKYFYRVRVKDSNGTWYSNSVKVELAYVDPIVTMPKLQLYSADNTFESFYVENGEQANYDFGTNGKLSMKFCTEGSLDGKVYVQAYLLEDEPDFSIDQSANAEIVYYQNQEFNAESGVFTLPTSTAKEGRYIRVKVTAYDENYELNETAVVSEFSIRIARHVAVFICNGDYAGTQNDLSGPPVDCAQMIATLNALDQAWEVHAYKDKDANDMKNAMNAHFSDTTENDICLFYYSGHGAQNGALCGVNGTYLTTSQLASSLNQYTKGKVIVLLDSCFSGASINVSSTDSVHHVIPTPREFNDSVIKAFQDLNASVISGRIQNKAGELCVADKFYVITACGKNQTSWDSSYPGYHAGYFTVHLLLGLGCHYPNATFDATMPGDVNDDWCLSLGEAFNYTTQAIYQDAGSGSDVQCTCAYGDPDFILFRRVVEE